MTLYEIDSKIRDFPFEVDPDTGEIMNVSALDALEMERNHKLESIACFYKNVSSDAKAIKEEEAALKKRREGLERTAERLKAYLSQSLNGQKFSSARAAVTFRKVERVTVDNAALAISSLRSGGFTDALRFREPEVDKAKVKVMLKAGMDIPGVKLEEIQSATIK